jgi:hypothetical protein
MMLSACSVPGSLGSQSDRDPIGRVEEDHQVLIQQQAEIRVIKRRLGYDEDLPNATSIDGEHLCVPVDFEIVATHRTPELALQELANELELLLVER